MLDLGWSELVIVAVLALVVVGPKDLPVLLRTVGQWVGKARAIAGDFRRIIDDAATESELADIRNQINKDVAAAGDDVKQAVTPPTDGAPTGSAPANAPAPESTKPNE
ncbi:MAG: Sec-independent protein translocase protein TatB [Alphaproteobacteria bacterium]